MSQRVIYILKIIEIDHEEYKIPASRAMLKLGFNPLFHRLLVQDAGKLIILCLLGKLFFLRHLGINVLHPNNKPLIPACLLMLHQCSRKSVPCICIIQPSDQKIRFEILLATVKKAANCGTDRRYVLIHPVINIIDLHPHEV